MRLKMRASLILVLATIASVGCAVGSPLILAAIERVWGLDWRRMADIGQAYGLASAMFSALAVAGVVVTIVYQARQLRMARLEAVFDRHRELLERVMEHPEKYGPALGMQKWQGRIPSDQFLFITNWVNHLAIAYDLGVMSERELSEESFAELFTGDLGRTWWTMTRKRWLDDSDRSSRSFAKIADEAYQRAVANGPPIKVPEVSQGQHVEQLSPSPNLMRSAIVIATAIAAGWILSRGRRLRPEFSRPLRD